MLEDGKKINKEGSQGTLKDRLFSGDVIVMHGLAHFRVCCCLRTPTVASQHSDALHVRGCKPGRECNQPAAPLLCQHAGLSLVAVPAGGQLRRAPVTSAYVGDSGASVTAGYEAIGFVVSRRGTLGKMFFFL